MRFRTCSSAATALAVLIAATFQYGAGPAAEAHMAGGGVVIQGHHIKQPPAIKATPVDNVRDFGATGNGVIDDTTAIQNAANDAASRHVGVFFPAGNYLHASSIIFNGVPVTGVGSTSILIANNPANCAVILTGSGSSIRNMVISTQGLSGSSNPTNPNTVTLAVFNALSYTVASNTIVQGSGIFGLLVGQSSTGSVSSNIFDGTGGSTDLGLIIFFGDNVTISNNLFQNETDGIVAEIGEFVGVFSNTIGNASFPTLSVGIELLEVFNCDVAQNTIQMTNATTGVQIVLVECNDSQVVGNNTFGGNVGIEIELAGNAGNFVTQNTIHNCGAQGILFNNTSTSAVQATSNVFGECGLTDSGASTNNAVILVNGTGADASGATTFVQNNSYQGHANGLVSYVTCTFTTPHIPVSNVSGNTFTQAVLPNNI